MMLKSVLPSQWLAMLREYRDYGTTTTKHPECSLRRLGSDGFADAVGAAEWAAFAGSEAQLDGELLNPFAATAPRVKLSKAGRNFLCSTAKMLDIDCMDAWTAACCVVGLPERLAETSAGNYALADADSPAAGPCSHIAQRLLQAPQSLLHKLQAANAATVPQFNTAQLLECVGYSPHSASGVRGELRAAWALQAVREQALLLRGVHTMAYTHNHMDSAHWLELAALLDAHAEFKPPAHLLEELDAGGATAAVVAERQHNALLALLTPLIAGFVHGNTHATRYAFQDEGLPRVQAYMREHIIPVVESAPPSSAKRPASRFQGAAAVIYMAWLTLNMMEHSHGGAGGARAGADALRGATKSQVESVVHGEAAHLALAHLHSVMRDLQDVHRAQAGVEAPQHWCCSARGTSWGMCACRTGPNLPKLFSSSALRLRPSASIPHAVHDAEMWALAPALRRQGTLLDGKHFDRDGGQQTVTDSSMQSVCIVIHDLMVGLVAALERLGCSQPPLDSGWWLAAAEGALRGAPDRASAVMGGASSIPGAHSAHMQLLAHACSEFPVHVLPSLRLLSASARASCAEVHAYLRHQVHTFTSVVTQGSADLAFPNGIQEGCTVVLRQPLLCDASGVVLPAGIAGTLLRQQACAGTIQELLSTSSPLQSHTAHNHSLPFTIKWHWRQPAVPVLLHRLGWLAWHSSSRASPASLGVELVAEMVATCDLLHGILTGPASHAGRLKQLRLVAADVVRARRHARRAAGDACGQAAHDNVKSAMLQSDPYFVAAGAAIPDLAISDIVQWVMHTLSSCVAAFAQAAQQQDDATAAWGEQLSGIPEAGSGASALLRSSSTLGGSSSVHHSVARSAAAAAGATAVHAQAAIADSHFTAWCFKLLQTASDLLNVLGEIAPAEMADVLSEPLGASNPKWTVPGASGRNGTSAPLQPLMGADKPLGVHLLQAAVCSLEGHALPLADSGLALALTGLLATVVRCIVHHSVRLTAERAFSLFDLDGDGDITLSEFADTLRALGIAADPQVVQELVRQLDINGDGKVQYNEFIRLVVQELRVATSTDTAALPGQGTSLSLQVALFVRQLVHRQPARMQLLGDLCFSATEALILAMQRVQDWQQPLERWLVAGSVASSLHLLCAADLDITAPGAASSTVKRSGVHTSEVVSLDRSLPLSASVVDALLGSPGARGALLASCSELAVSGLQSCSTGTDDLRSIWNHSALQSVSSPEHVDALHSYTSTMLSVLQCALDKSASLDAVARTLTATVQTDPSSSAASAPVVHFVDCLAAYCTYHLTDPAVEPHASQLISRAVQDTQSDETHQELQRQLNFIRTRVVTATDVSVQAARFFPLVALAAARFDDHTAGSQPAAPVPKHKRQRILAATEADSITDRLFGMSFAESKSMSPPAQLQWASAAATPPGVPQWYRGGHLLPHNHSHATAGDLQALRPLTTVSLARLLEKLTPQIASALFGHSSTEEPPPATAPLRTTDAPRVLRTTGLNLAAFALHYELPIAGALLAPGGASTLRSVALPSGLVEAAVTISASERIKNKQPALFGAALSVVSALATKASSRPWVTSALRLLGSHADFWTGMQDATDFSEEGHQTDVDSDACGISALRFSNQASAVLLCCQLVACFQPPDSEPSSQLQAATNLLHTLSHDTAALRIISRCFEADLASVLQGAQSSALDGGVSLAPFRAELTAAAHFAPPFPLIEAAVSTIDSIQSTMPWASRYGGSFMFQLYSMQAVLPGAVPDGAELESEVKMDIHDQSQVFKFVSRAGSYCSLYDAATALARGVHACCLIAKPSAAISTVDFALQCCKVMERSPCQLQLELAPVMHLARAILALVSSEFGRAEATAPAVKWQAVLTSCANSLQKLIRLRPRSWTDAYPRTDSGALSNLGHASAASSAIRDLAHSPNMQASAAIAALTESCCILLQNKVNCSEDTLLDVLQCQLDTIGSSQVLHGRPLPLIWHSGEWICVSECDEVVERVIGAAREEFAAACSALAVILSQNHEQLRVLQQLTLHNTVSNLIRCFTMACDAVSALHEWHATWWRKHLRLNQQSAASAATGGTVSAKPNAAFVRVRSDLLTTAESAMTVLLALAAVPGGPACLLASGALRSLSAVSVFQGMESVLHARLKAQENRSSIELVTQVPRKSQQNVEWSGVGYGLGPSEAPGLDQSGEACAAHALWRATVQLFSTCISSFIQAKHQEEKCMAARLPLGADGSLPPRTAPVLSRRLSAALSSTSIESPEEGAHILARDAWHRAARSSSTAAARMAVAPALLEQLASESSLRRSMTADRLGAWINGSSSYEATVSGLLPPSAGCMLDALCQDAIAFVDKHKSAIVCAFIRPLGRASQELSVYAKLLCAMLHPDCVPAWLRMCNSQAAASHGGKHTAPFPEWDSVLKLSGIELDTTPLLGGCVYPIAVLLAAAEECSRRLIIQTGKRENWFPRQRMITVHVDGGARTMKQAGESTVAASHHPNLSAVGRRVPVPRLVVQGCSDGLAQAANSSTSASISLPAPPDATGVGTRGDDCTPASTAERFRVLQDLLAVCVAGTQHAQSPLSQLLAPHDLNTNQGTRDTFHALLWEEFCRKWRPWALRAMSSSLGQENQAAVAAIVHVAAQRAGLQLSHAPRGSLFGFNSRCLFGAVSGASDVLQSDDSPAGVGHMLLVLSHCMQSQSQLSSESSTLRAIAGQALSLLVSAVDAAHQRVNKAEGHVALQRAIACVVGDAGVVHDALGHLVQTNAGPSAVVDSAGAELARLRDMQLPSVSAGCLISGNSMSGKPISTEEASLAAAWRQATMALGSVLEDESFVQSTVRYMHELLTWRGSADSQDMESVLEQSK